ncbi:uncharacterized protein TNIN_385261 [Trichonephila inaurata madagascariensis]|uniref:MULE transposase domain-containing protein n=1 Tax=Trichonephila inaurata madagascariensis TaxID=2747483 RepID=A0A8X6YNP8_9ARAC|nr:uncharacterized protein TNIN_385261 [Trichonephila inaurata madagascariensis]
MKVYEDIESKVTVEFTKTHVGHGIDLGRMKITREEKEDIARKLENKIPVEAILDDIRNSMNQKLERIHLITRQDIKNIKEEYNISLDGILDSNDVVSVNKWIEGLKNREDSPIVLFKDQNIFDETLYPGMKAEDFLLVIMNSSQKDMLKFYGNDTICLDFTHGMNAYGFDLATLNFTCISPRVLMTDDSESFYNAWKIVFGIPEKRLLCTWHVDRSWRRSISRLITKKEIQVEAYKIVRSLLVETDEAAFNIMLKEALKMFDEKEEMKEFKRYFELTYSKRSEVWAYCHRKWYGINTNMHIESMHKTIKYVYLQGKKVKRLDKALFSLMKFVRDRVFDRLISLEKGKISSKISQRRKRHKVGQHLTSLCIQNNEEWSVSSTRGKDIYIVKRNVTCSKECTLMCRECNHCLHNFTCTCIDNAVQWNMCKHIHFICSQNLNKINSTILEERLSLDSRITDEEMIICENRKILEKEAHVDNLRATSTRTEISKEKFPKKRMHAISK